MTPSEKVVLALRAPIEPSHGVYEVWRRLLDAAAILIEQNEAILAELKPAEKK